MPQRLHLTQKSHCKSSGYLFAYVLGNTVEAGGLADVRPPGAKLFNRVIHRFGGYALSMAVLLVVAGITILNVAAARGDNGRSLQGSARSFLHPLAPALSRHFRVQSSGARSSACGLLSHFREPVVLTSHLMEMLLSAGVIASAARPRTRAACLR
jgi:hypothetical protein